MSESEVYNNDDLVKEIAENKGKLVIFAGAGIPTATGIPGWKTLLIGLAKKLNDKKLKELVEKSNDSEYPIRAQEIYEAFIENDIEAEGEQKYKSAIDELLETKDWDYSPSQLCIWHACKKILTTNFDSTFNEAYDDYYRFREEEKPSLDTQCLPDLKHEDIWEEEKNLVYLHGNKARKIIFKQSDYDLFYSDGNGNRKIIDFFKPLYRSKILLFIGFSFNDKNIFRMIDRIHKELSDEDGTAKVFDDACNQVLPGIRHYAFMNNESCECERELELLENKFPKASSEYITESHKIKARQATFEKLCEDLKQINIIPLKYTNHKDYRKWLNVIADYREENVLDADNQPNSDSVFKRLN